MSIAVFTDGASSGNPGPGGWGAIIVAPKAEESLQVQELSGSDAHTTNNRMELLGSIRALETVLRRALPETCVELYTDSTYVIRGITEWIHGWKKKGWKTAEGKDVLNQDLWEALDGVLGELRRAGKKVEWKHIPGHAGIHGNERADELAVQQTKGFTPQHYEGSLKNYGIPILDLSQQEQKKTKTAPTQGQGPSYYLSLVGNTPARHSTWAECEARVKGVSGARYKKVSSREEERETLASWNFAGTLPSD